MIIMANIEVTNMNLSFIILINSLKNLVITILQPESLFMIFIIGIGWYFFNKNYEKGAYYQNTHCPYFKMKFDIGRYGEYLTYKSLKDYEKKGAKFLFNVYVPKEDGEFSEIDVVMIHPNGIFVFESKNYSGWIFGNEKQLYWYQTLPQGRGKSHKEKFYNPILQNKGHIKHLKNFLNEEVNMYSLIVFSKRCTLKDVTVTSPNVKVINRYNVRQSVKKIIEQNSTYMLNTSEIDSIYNNLYMYTQLSDEDKRKHVENIHNKLDKDSKFEPTFVVEETDTSVTLEDQVSTNSEVEVETEIKEDLTVTEKNVDKICPNCGSVMIIRVANKGKYVGKKFYGCSNFPKCRYVEEYKE